MADSEFSLPCLSASATFESDAGGEQARSVRAEMSAAARSVLAVLRAVGFLRESSVFMEPPESVGQRSPCNLRVARYRPDAAMLRRLVTSIGRGDSCKEFFAPFTWCKRGRGSRATPRLRSRTSNLLFSQSTSGRATCLK